MILDSFHSLVRIHSIQISSRWFVLVIMNWWLDWNHLGLLHFRNLLYNIDIMVNNYLALSINIRFLSRVIHLIGHIDSFRQGYRMSTYRPSKLSLLWSCWLEVVMGTVACGNCWRIMPMLQSIGGNISHLSLIHGPISNRATQIVDCLGLQFRHLLFHDIRMVNRGDLSIFVRNLRKLLINFAILFLNPDESISLLLHTGVYQGLLPFVKEHLRVAFGSTIQILFCFTNSPICYGVIKRHIIRLLFAVHHQALV